MGLFGWLFGTKPGRADAPQTEPFLADAEVRSPFAPEFITIPSRKFFGQSVKSPNGRFTLAWRDANEAGTHGGHRQSGPGRYLLMQGSRVLADGKMPRPNDGKVADDGTFILNDWQFGEGLRGTFWAFRPNGERCFAQKFKANLYNNGLSADGRFAACQTCNADDAKDGSVLAVFDLTKGVEVARWRAASGWPDYYDFAVDGSTLGLGHRGLGVFRYTLSGEFLDRLAWEEAILTTGDYSSVLMMGEALISQAGRKPEPELADKLIRAVDRVLPGIPDKNWKAVAMKLRGIFHEARGEITLAIENYDAALDLNPKIGLKRRAAQLRKDPSAVKSST